MLSTYQLWWSSKYTIHWVSGIVYVLSCSSMFPPPLAVVQQHNSPTSTTTPLGSMTQQALHRCAITCRAHRFHPVGTTMANPWTSNHHNPLTYNNDLIKSHFLETTVKDTYVSSVLSLSHHHPLEAGTNAICHPLGEALVVHPHTSG